MDTNSMICCIVRCKNAGVHIGYIANIGNSAILTLTNSRRLWAWWSKFTLSGLATEGPLQSKLSEQKYACVIPVMHIPVHDICEIIEVSEKARIAIYAVKEVINE